MKHTFLDELVVAYENKHGNLPAEVICTPVAAVALAIKNSLSSSRGVPVVVRDFVATEASASGTRLGVFVYSDRSGDYVTSVDLA